MDNTEFDAQAAGIPRRDFIKLGVGASAMIALDPLGGSAQSVAGQPVSIDLHTHWVPEAYNKALARLKRPMPASTNPLDFDLDKRRKWMDEHGVQMHVLTLSGMPWQWVRRTSERISRRSLTMLPWKRIPHSPTGLSPE
jgi:hypothetical protein